MIGSPKAALANASIVQLWFSTLEIAETSTNIIKSQGAIATKFCCQAGLSRSPAWLRCANWCQNGKVVNTAQRYSSPASTNRLVLRFGVMSGCPRAIAVRQTPAARYRNVNRVNRLMVFSLCSAQFWKTTNLRWLPDFVFDKGGSSRWAALSIWML